MRGLMLGALVILAGCATTTAPMMPPPLAIPDAVAPISDAPRAVEPLILPMLEPSANPVQVIHRANEAALVQPTADDFARAVAVFAYRPGALYRIDLALQMPTDIVLQPGERLVSLVSGDERIKYQVSEGIDPVHVALMPTRERLRTRVLLTSTLGSYYLEVWTQRTTGLVAVSWRHPTPPKTAPNHGRYGIGYGVTDPSQPFAPVYVWDDQRRTYVLLPERVLVTEAPILAILDGAQRSLVNYRQMGRVYRVDRLFDRAELRLGGHEEARTVEIVRTEGYHVIDCPGHEACGVIRRYMPPTGIREAHGAD